MSDLPFSTPTVPITLLEAVNMLLASVGTAEVMSLAASESNEEVQRALATISKYSRQVQSLGWHFNVDEEYPVTPDEVYGQIVLAEEQIFLGVHRRSAYRFVTQRGQKLYDTKNHTFTWINGTSGEVTDQPLQNTLYINIATILPFEDVPQPVRWLIMAKAGRVWAVGRVPDSATFKFTDVIYQDALMAAQQWDNDARQQYAEQNPHYNMMRRR